MLQVIPETDSPITHNMSSNDKLGGIQATIFLKRPKPFFYHDILDDDNEEIVYLTATNVAEFFEPFFISKENALVMTLGVYLNILRFMKESWPEILKAIKDKICLLKNPCFPLKLAHNINLLSEGNVVYERWFDECFFFYYESSKDVPGTKRLIHLQIRNKSVQVEPEVLYNMSFQYESLLNIVTRAGYIYQGPISENIQFNNAL
jgi:hypothetical protein